VVKVRRRVLPALLGNAARETDFGPTLAAAFRRYGN
jgi:hypothetical protein